MIESYRGDVAECGITPLFEATSRYVEALFSDEPTMIFPAPPSAEADESQ